MISNNKPNDLSPDVKYAYDTFIKSAIGYFKVVDNNDLLQEEYNDVKFPDDICSVSTSDSSSNLHINNEANKLLMRSIKIDLPTLDKYVKRSSNKKEQKCLRDRKRYSLLGWNKEETSSLRYLLRYSTRLVSEKSKQERPLSKLIVNPDEISTDDLNSILFLISS